MAIKFGLPREAVVRHLGYSRWEELTALSQTHWPNLNFACLLVLAPWRLIASRPLKLWAITTSTAIPKFKDRSRDSTFAATVGRQYVHQI